LGDRQNDWNQKCRVCDDWAILQHRLAVLEDKFLKESLVVTLNGML
jgi:hypothetical protein